VPADFERVAEDAVRILGLLCRPPSVSAEGRALDETAEPPPFEPTHRDGKLFARGAADNEGELAVRLAVRALREDDGELPIGIRWIVEGEEEIGSTNFDEIVRRNAELLRADGALWEGGGARLPDGRPEAGLGFAGSRVHGPNEHIKLEDIEPALRCTHALLQSLGDAAS
jgi:acetylornithine deacetylase/succinyl-diaminopimelate desuccinylase-like protein